MIVCANEENSGGMPFCAFYNPIHSMNCSWQHCLTRFLHYCIIVHCIHAQPQSHTPHPTTTPFVYSIVYILPIARTHTHTIVWLLRRPKRWLCRRSLRNQSGDNNNVPKRSPANALRGCESGCRARQDYTVTHSHKHSARVSTKTLNPSRTCAHYGHVRKFIGLASTILPYTPSQMLCLQRTEGVLEGGILTQWLLMVMVSRVNPKQTQRMTPPPHSLRTTHTITLSTPMSASFISRQHTSIVAMHSEKDV